ncbi:DUF948 domain-containing protein [Geodermatophilus sp. TF02-6]|uniref:DUF948 domain-containing protein n=1 Tax=Geodermatophilus sp. TF02-6 TaxID=2250575 RepID=UPI000DE82D16|nr:DUF948 domain-containing protein [Geodermatophilus sp. TF02-6]RBY76729.1 DUF948 domain-containing protein [Geodermatophilus sp. TF02-6]
MSPGEWAGLVAALALLLLVGLLAVPLLKLGRTLDEATLAIREAREQAASGFRSAPPAVPSGRGVPERVDDTRDEVPGAATGSAPSTGSAPATGSVPATRTAPSPGTAPSAGFEAPQTSVVAATVGGSLIKVAAYGHGLRAATRRRLAERALAEAARSDRELRRALRTARQGARGTV